MIDSSQTLYFVSFAHIKELRTFLWPSQGRHPFMTVGDIASFENTALVCLQTYAYFPVARIHPKISNNKI